MASETAKAKRNYFLFLFFTSLLPIHFSLLILRNWPLVLLVALTLEGYGFQTSAFYKILNEFRDQYFEILMSECRASFVCALQNDNYTPMVVDTEADYQKVVERFPFHQRLTSSYPKKLPFSSMVPTIYDQLKAFVRAALRFMENLDLGQSEVEDIVRRKTNVLLERLCECLRHFMSSKKLALVQLVQITINMAYLERSCESLDQLVSKLVGSAHSGDGNNAPPPVAGYLVRVKDDVFRGARSEAEQEIDAAMRHKIDDFLGLATYDWDASEPTGRASEYITDLVAFLNSTFLSFTNLPPALARHVAMQACKYLSSCLMRYLTSADQPKSVTMGALEQFNLDVIQCELFTAQCPVAGFDEPATLTMTFADLRQLLDLFMQSDWTNYLADYGRHSQGKYVRVQPHAAAALLEKVMESERRKNTLFGKGKDKDRKRLMESILKQLKALTC